MADQGPSERPGREPWQFTIRSMLVLTAVSAVAASLAASMRMPRACRLVVAVYLMALAAYAVLRLPYCLRGMMRQTPGWEHLRRQRAELEKMTREKKCGLEPAEPSPQSTGSTDD